MLQPARFLTVAAVLAGLSCRSESVREPQRGSEAARGDAIAVTPASAPDQNRKPQAASAVIRAGADGQPYPSSPIATPDARRLAVTGAAPAFDRAAYLRDPAAWCAMVAPGRCNEIALPSPQVALLEVAGPTSFACPVGSSVLLRARTDPGMPITWTSLGLGVFPVTGLNSQTVAAGADGVAAVEFAVTPGTTGHIQIVAGSPVRAGQVTSIITVNEPPRSKP